jgi:hypothetical protein
MWNYTTPLGIVILLNLWDCINNSPINFVLPKQSEQEISFADIRNISSEVKPYYLIWGTVA